jgi:hypothetical protein
MLKRLGNCTALRVGLQRQVMVHGWSFGELGQLDKLDVVATVELLNALNVRPPRGFEDDSEDDLERLIIDAHKHIGAVKSDAVKAARKSGIDLPAPNPYMIGSWVEDSVVVDRAHAKLNEVRFRLVELLARGGWRRFDAENLEQLLMATAAGGTIAGSVAMMVPHIPEAWNEVQAFGGELAGLIEYALRASGRMISPLLSTVLVVRTADITFDSPGGQPSSDSSPLAPPDDGTPGVALQGPSGIMPAPSRTVSPPGGSETGPQSNFPRRIVPPGSARNPEGPGTSMVDPPGRRRGPADNPAAPNLSQSTPGL